MAAPIAVHVRVHGYLAARLGPRRTLELQGPATVAALLRRLGEDAGTSVAGVVIARRGTILGPEGELADGDELAVVVPVAGG